MRFSIVTVSFNQAEFLEQALLSVLNQRGVDVEYIVVDPGSTDGSREIIAKYRERLSHVILESDQGPGDGLNKGFARAHGEIFGYLNSDDLLLPGTLVKVGKYFSRHRQADVVSAHGYIIDGQGRIVQRAFSRKFDLGRFAAGCGALLQQSTFIRAEAFRRTKGFNPANRTCWDGELAVDLALSGAKFAVVHDYWSGFRVHPKSISGCGDPAGAARYRADQARILERLPAREPSPLVGKLRRLVAWLREPRTLMMRMADGIAHPERVL